MKNKIKICFLVRVPFAVLHKEYISGKLPKCFSQFRLHFRLCLGSCVEKASCLPWDGAQVGLTSISFMILFETSQSHETPSYPYLMPHPYLGLYCTATSMLHHWWWCYPLCTLQHKPKCEGWDWGMPWKTGDKDSYCSSSAHWFALVLTQSLTAAEEVEGNQG